MKFEDKEEYSYISILKKCIGNSVKLRNHPFHLKYQTLTEGLR
jgi:hypothetical protein